MLRSGWQATPRQEVLGSDEKGRAEPLCIPEASLRVAAQEGTGMPRRGETSRICSGAEFKAGGAKGAGRPLWSLRAASLPGAAGGALTTLADVHAEQGQLGALRADAVEVLAVQLGLPLLLPQLHPADVTAAVEEVLLQPPVGKERGGDS